MSPQDSPVTCSMMDLIEFAKNSRTKSSLDDNGDDLDDDQDDDQDDDNRPLINNSNK